ncbi:unnamed protein product [Amoebophrya sp. A120]|nr:unnamed protein product [Amoebophrya sp. A120]CAD7962320.1 unnamed protein product [Amoebophrya sp. A120]|eukprot:GSA120T00008971001.1
MTNFKTPLENASRGAPHEKHFKHADLHDNYGVGTFLHRIRDGIGQLLDLMLRAENWRPNDATFRSIFQRQYDRMGRTEEARKLVREMEAAAEAVRDEAILETPGAAQSHSTGLRSCPLP